MRDFKPLRIVTGDELLRRVGKLSMRTSGSEQVRGRRVVLSLLTTGDPNRREQHDRDLEVESNVDMLFTDASLRSEEASATLVVDRLCRMFREVLVHALGTMAEEQVDESQLLTQVARHMAETGGES